MPNRETPTSCHRTFSSRSNVIRVKDPEAFKAKLAEREIDLSGPNDDGYCSFGTTNTDSIVWTGLPNVPITYGGLVALVAPHLCDGEVCIVQEVGLELCGREDPAPWWRGNAVGVGIAFDSTGDWVALDIDEIFERARAAFDSRPEDRPDDGRFATAWN